MAKHSRRGSWTRTRQVEEVRARTVLGSGLYAFVARDGQARWTGVWIGRQAEASQADRSFHEAAVGRL